MTHMGLYELNSWLTKQSKKPDVCWPWPGNIASHGYGRIGAYGKSHRAHRFVYEMTVGPIPDGLVIDHLCGRKDCVNPAHMETVPQSINMQRAGVHRQKDRCVHGHAIDGIRMANGKQRRYCKTCNAANSKKHRDKS